MRFTTASAALPTRVFQRLAGFFDVAARLAQAIALAVETGDNPIFVWNFKEAEAQDVAGARGLFVGGAAVGVAETRGCGECHGRESCRENPTCRFHQRSHNCREKRECLIAFVRCSIDRRVAVKLWRISAKLG